MEKTKWATIKLRISVPQKTQLRVYKDIQPN